MVARMLVSLMIVAAGALLGGAAGGKLAETRALHRLLARTFAAEIDAELQRTRAALDGLARELPAEARRGRALGAGVEVQVVARLAEAARRLPALSRLLVYDAERQARVAFDVDAPVGS